MIKVGLIYTEEFQKYNFGPEHPLRPLRLELTYSLMEKLNLPLEVNIPQDLLLDAIENLGLIYQLLDHVSTGWSLLSRWCAILKFLFVIIGLFFIISGGLFVTLSRNKNL